MNQEIRQALTDWNPWLVQEFPAKLLGFNRDYDLRPYLQVPEIKIIEGARRVGKSTLLYAVIHKVMQQGGKLLYINFEDEVLKKYSLADIVYEYLEYAQLDYLFVDELQNCNDWVQFIRKVYDRKEFKQIWVSGSNASLIKAEYATLLTGRNLPIQISTLSFREFLTFKSVSCKDLVFSKNDLAKIAGLFSEYMEFGAFPAVVDREVYKKELLLAYFEDFIYKDIVARHKVDPQKIKSLAIYLATNSSKLFSYRKAAVALQCHLNTVIDYMGHLKDAFLFEELHKYDYSLQNQMTHDKKVYCLDTGLAASISFKFSKDEGRILENIIYHELRRRFKEIYFHKTNYECDFIIKIELRISLAIQVCLDLEDADTRQREYAGLIDAMRTYKLNKGLIITMSEEDAVIVNEDSKAYIIEIVPAWKWLLKKEKDENTK